MGELSKLPNIGPVVEQQLEAVGIETLAQLQEIGSREAWLRIQRIDPSACIHRLMGLEGALLGVKKSLLPPDIKIQLKSFYQAHKL